MYLNFNAILVNDYFHEDHTSQLFTQLTETVSKVRNNAMKASELGVFIFIALCSLQTVPLLLLQWVLHYPCASSITKLMHSVK